MRWKIDDEALGKIKSLSSADIEGIMDEAERVVADNLKESKGRSAAKLEVDREKYIRDNMPEWKDNPDAFDEEDYAKGYRNYWNRSGYDIVYTPEDGWYSVVDENGDSLKDFRTLEEAEEYALERWWDDNVYDELDYKEDYNEDNPQNLNRKKFEYAAKRIGVDVLRHEEAFTGSEYVWIKLPNGLEKKIRFADHPQVYSADMSVENSWEDAFRFLVERLNANDWDEDYNDGDFVSFYSKPAAGEAEDARAFRSELAKVEAGTLPTYKILKLGRPSETLLGIGVPDRPISLRQSVIKKILEKHGLGYDLISKLPEAINDPIAIFSYPKNENVRDILLELRDKNGRAIMASLKLNVSTQRYGEVSDLATVHPKENIGRIYDWIKKGRLLYWDKQKGRKFLQDSALIKLEQYGTELSPLFPPSENASESQGGNLNFYAAPRVSEGRPANADGGGRAGAGGRGISASARAYLDAADSIEAINAKSARAARRKAENDAERGIKRRGVLRKISDRTKLPSGVKLDKKTGRLAGLANPAEIRRYLAKALDVGVYPGMDVARHKNALGTYNNLLEIVRLRGGHINDMNVVGHELGHHLERLMFDYHLPDADTPLKRELERFCVSRFEGAYPPKLRAREGWAQFVSEWIANPQAAEVEAPIAGAAMRQLSRAFPKIGKILDNAREMLSLWQNADPNAKTEANIKFSDEARPREGEGVVAFLKRLYEQGQLHGADRLYGLKNAQRIVNDRTGKSADFYERARTMKGAASENSQWSREVRQTDLNGEEIGESLEEICAEKNTGVSLRRFEAYLVARRAMAYYRRNPEESADTCRAKFGNDYATLSKVEGAATDKMRVAALRLDKFQKNSLKLLLDGGVIDMQTFERLSVQKGYVPLRRIMEELDAAESGGGGGLKKPLKNFHGSDREIISPIAQIADNEQFFRQLAMKNRLYSQIVDSIVWLPRGGELLSDYKDTSEKVNINYKEFAKSLAKSEFAREIAELDGIDWFNERELVAFACFSGAPKRKMSGCCAVLRRL